MFEDLSLDPYGNRVPQISVEVFRRPPNTSGEPVLEELVQGVSLIPASGEFSYATTPVSVEYGPGEEVTENLNNTRGVPDIVAALDDLEAQAPNCRSVVLVISWFGDDLRCGSCHVQPGVEQQIKVSRPLSWRVSGITRGAAYVVTQAGGRPNFGGTPTDASVLEAIAELKARGFSVSFYPFVLMDIPSANGRPDPYGGSEQSAFPGADGLRVTPRQDKPVRPTAQPLPRRRCGAFSATPSWVISRLVRAR